MHYFFTPTVDMITKKCLFCGKEFRSKNCANRKFCSQKCYHTNKIGKNSINKNCKFCKKEFNSRVVLKQDFCSKRCCYSFRKGKPSPLRGRVLSVELKSRISIATKKAMNKLSPEVKARLHPKGERRSIATEFKKGRQYTLEQKLKMSSRAKELGFGKWMKGRTPAFITQGKHFQHPKGENHPNWDGGKSFEPYTTTFNKQLKERVRVRDNFVCKLCGVPELECKERLSIHHIDYDKKNCDVSNLVTLCRSCNAKVNFNRDKWKEHFLATITIPLLLI